MTATRRTARGRTLATIVVGVALGVSLALGGGVAGLASAAPKPAPTGCGQNSDNPKTDKRLYLWGQVKDTAPGKVGTNIDVIKPGPQYQPSPAHPKFYAVRKGGDSKGVNDDFLLLPTNRIKGIECSYLWNGSQLNLWSAAWFQATQRVAKNPAKPIALGVNSATARGQDQLHIHLAQTNPDTVADLKAIKNPATSFTNWMGTNVRLRINDPKKTKTHAQFRVVKYTGSLPNLFVTLQKALPANETMSSQSIAVIDAGTPNTYYVLNSTPGLPGQQSEHGTGLADYVYGWKY